MPLGTPETLLQQQSMPKVVWLRPIRGRYGKTVQRIEATLISVTEDYCTIELENGERFAARTEDVKLMKGATA
jgi:hypothetical protein